MKVYSQYLLFLPPGKLLAQLELDPAEKENFYKQRDAAIAADTQGDRFKI